MQYTPALQFGFIYHAHCTVFQKEIITFFINFNINYIANFSNKLIKISDLPLVYKNNKQSFS